jgi:hypothetical protein
MVACLTRQKLHAYLASSSQTLHSPACCQVKAKHATIGRACHGGALQLQHRGGTWLVVGWDDPSADMLEVPEEL